MGCKVGVLQAGGQKTPTMGCWGRERLPRSHASSIWIMCRTEPATAAVQTVQITGASGEGSPRTPCTAVGGSMFVRPYEQMFSGLPHAKVATAFKDCQVWHAHIIRTSSGQDLPPAPGGRAGTDRGKGCQRTAGRQQDLRGDGHRALACRHMLRSSRLWLRAFLGPGWHLQGVRRGNGGPPATGRRAP